MGTLVREMGGMGKMKQKGVAGGRACGNARLFLPCSRQVKVTRMTQVCLHIPQFDCPSKIVEAISHPEEQLKKNVSYGIQVGVQNDS